MRSSSSSASSSSFTFRGVLVLSLLLVAAVVLSVVSYAYYTQVSASVGSLSLNEIHSNAQIEAGDLGNLLAKSLQSVSSNLDVVAYSRAVSVQNASAAKNLFSAAENSTRSLTFTYFWVDSSGILLLTNNGTGGSIVYASGTNLSARAFFTVPKETGMTYYSSATQSIRNSSVDYIFISRPIFSFDNTTSRQGTFDGVVGAAIDLRTLGKSLQSEISPNFNAQVGLVDFKGTILYSGNESLIGVDVFGSTFQATLPGNLKPQFNSFLDDSLKGQAGYEDLSYNGASSTLAYQPIFVNATTQTGGQKTTQFGVLYVTTQDTLAASAAGLIDRGEIVSLLMVVGITGASGALAVTILRWNKRLNDAVRQRTSALFMANEELEAKARAEKDLMNITAHELRTPTQSILANTEILRHTIRPALGFTQLRPEGAADGTRSIYDSMASDIQPSEIVELVESSYRNAQRLQKLTKNILEVARIENKTSKLEIETFDLNVLVKEMIDERISIQNREGNERRRMVYSYEANQIRLPVQADRLKVGEVLGNLLDNAERFSPEGGLIKITTDRRDGDFAVVTVKDEGSGIDPEILPRLFGKFATKSGTGLGLYISKSYVEAQGGSIGVENTDGMKGATFIFTLPLAK